MGALTNLSRKVFSRRAPMQPAKPSTDMTPPTTTNSHTGSRPPRSVSAEMLERTPCAGGEEAGVRGFPPPHPRGSPTPYPTTTLPSHPRPRGQWPGTGLPAPAKPTAKSSGMATGTRTLTHPSLILRGLQGERGTRAVSGI